MPYPVTISNLFKKIQGKMRISPFSCQWDASRGIGIVGRPGSGKTTLAKILCGINPPSYGTVAYGEDYFSPFVRKMRQRIAFVSPLAKIPDGFTAQKLGDFFAGLYPHWEEDRFRDLLQGYAIDSKLKFKKLSAGQRTFIGILASLCPKPELLIFDEPFRDLDGEELKSAKKFIFDYLSTSSSGMMIFTDDPKYLEGICKTIVVFERGQYCCQFSLDGKKERFKKLTVIPRHDFELDEFKLDGVLNVEYSGDRLSLIIHRNFYYHSW
jgi:ABC-2 type transport system ATP-binding protein